MKKVTDEDLIFWGIPQLLLNVQCPNCGFDTLESGVSLNSKGDLFIWNICINCH